MKPMPIRITRLADGLMVYVFDTIEAASRWYNTMDIDGNLKQPVEDNWRNISIEKEQQVADLSAMIK